MNAADCFVCKGAPRGRGLLCAECLEGLPTEDLCPEQVAGRAPVPEVGAACALLIDGFGLPHTALLSAKMPASLQRVTLGRARGSDVQVAERTVSLEHAALEFRGLSHAWFVEDRGSENGTFVNGDRVKTRFPLEPRDVIGLGRRAAFLFVPLEEADVPGALAELQWLRARFPEEHTQGDPGLVSAVVLTIAVAKEGGAIARWGSESVQLSELELELLMVLQRALDDDAASDSATRGFLPADMLLERLSFTSEAPTHANLRGLVRKLRKKLVEGDTPLDVVESRRGLGYRLARPLTM